MFLYSISTSPSPNEKILTKELETVKQHYTAMSDQMDLMSKALNNIQRRDADVHRTLLGMDPIDEDIWNGGKGGQDLYDEFRNLPTTGEIVGKTSDKNGAAGRQLVIQSKSLDKLQESRFTQRRYVGIHTPRLSRSRG